MKMAMIDFWSVLCTVPLNRGTLKSSSYLRESSERLWVFFVKQITSKESIKICLKWSWQEHQLSLRWQSLWKWKIHFHKWKMRQYTFVGSRANELNSVMHLHVQSLKYIVGQRTKGANDIPDMLVYLENLTKQKPFLEYAVKKKELMQRDEILIASFYQPSRGRPEVVLSLQSTEIMLHYDNPKRLSVHFSR